ncbi:unnamed protein product [Spirodela intermedia]|uniref:C2 domain-containing protein n=1 Tax=Spirodela intermedia TaxID=51605 RepID=A0A7I8IU63_SPIIN|nr:unnamed protein product [Spirodela intermedia]CAA6661327.1 unnamed protein product [Spirodela intermedia]
MLRKRTRELYTREAAEFLRHVAQEKPLLPFLIPLALLAWAVERWLTPISNWPITPSEPCEWLNKLFIDVWPNYMVPKLSRTFSSIVEVKLFTDALAKKMVEPRRGCFTLPPVNLRKKAVEGVLHVTVMSAEHLQGSIVRTNSAEDKQNQVRGGPPGESPGKTLQTFVEVESGEVSRRTKLQHGLARKSQALKFHLYQWRENSVKFDYLASCEIKIRYVEDDSTIFWAVGPGSGTLTKRADCCGKEVDMVVPFEGSMLSVKLVLKEWHYSDGSHSLNSTASILSQPSNSGFRMTVIEGKNLLTKSGKCSPYVKLHYGKTIHKTKTIPHVWDPLWNEPFEFDEIGGGEYLKITCYNEDWPRRWFGQGRLGPLEKVTTGELRLQIEARKKDKAEGSSCSSRRTEAGLIELNIIEARDLIGADLRGTSDPYVRVQYGSVKKRTKVIHKTLNPVWNQTLEFPDTGGQLNLHVKDYNALLPTSSIGHCMVEYESIGPNQTADKWIPLQGVMNGEIHVQITRKVPELEKKSSMDGSTSSSGGAREISNQSTELLKKLQSSLKGGDLESLPLALAELESIKDEQDEYMWQLETEKALLLEKISELYREINNTSPSPTRKALKN